MGGSTAMTTTRRTRESTAEILAPPESDTSKESTPAPEEVIASEPDTPPPKRKRRPSEYQEYTMRDKNAVMPKKKSRFSPNEIMNDPSDTTPPDFVSSYPNLNPHNGKVDTPNNSSQATIRNNNNSDEEELFAKQRSSQAKTKNTYSRSNVNNIHKAIPKKKEKAQGKSSGPLAEVVRTGTNGFKTADTEAMMAKLRTPKKKKQKETFKTTQVLSCLDSMPPADSSHDQRILFKQPLVVSSVNSSPASKKRICNPHETSEANNGQTPPRTTRSQAKRNDDLVPEISKIHSIKDMRELVGDVETRLKVQQDPAASSMTVSSGRSAGHETDHDDDSSVSSLSMPPDPQEIDASKEHQEFLEKQASQRAESPKARCPICKSCVSRLFLQEFSASDHLKTREQARFCRAHKVRSAERDWEEKGYPSIDWPALQQRLRVYGERIDDLLRGNKNSFYRNAFQDQVSSGKDRTLQQALMSGNGWEGLMMGYYGSKGARVIMEYIMSTFAARIRRRAAHDQLISTAGVSGFVQAVLAPELAVMLVKDDMKVDDEEARVILRDSTGVGNLLNEEEDEVIQDGEEKEENLKGNELQKDGLINADKVKEKDPRNSFDIIPTANDDDAKKH
ncbi:MAG: hypothetical protein Q9190_003778 [Brigantiaea leucoxantha]